MSEERFYAVARIVSLDPASNPIDMMAIVARYGSEEDEFEYIRVVGDGLNVRTVLQPSATAAIKLVEYLADWTTNGVVESVVVVPRHNTQ